MNDQLVSRPIETDAVDSLLEPEDEYALGESLLDARRIRLPRGLVWGILVLFVLAIITAAVWGLINSTWTYGAGPVDSATTARLVQLRAKLAAAGAPAAALRCMDIAAQPGINIGDAIEALVSADKELDAVSEQAAIAAPRQELRLILEQLSGSRYGSNPSSGDQGASLTPLPTLAITMP